MASLFTDLLMSLGVKHTQDYSDMRFSQMPFPSLFGMVELLKDYGVGSRGVFVPPASRAAAFREFKTPFVADTEDGFIIVTDISGDEATYLSQHEEFRAGTADLVHAWNGIALLAQADEGSVEPGYGRHRIALMSQGVKRWVLYAAIALLTGWAMYSSGLYSSWYGWVLLLLNCMGLAFSVMLVQKSLGIKSKKADAVCSALEEGGCDSIATSEASEFFGIFKWSEVGLSYFSVNLGAMLLCSGSLPALAAANIMCLPYTVWSIWYQRFKAKTWCTLCVLVQCTLWLLFFTFLLGGVTLNMPLGTGDFWIDFVVLGCSYVALLLGLNSVDSALIHQIKK